MTAHRDSDDSAEQVEANDPMESAEQVEPIEAIERNEPTLPIDSIDPFEPIDRKESSDHKDQRDVSVRFNISAVWPTGDKSGTTRGPTHERDLIVRSLRLRVRYHDAREQKHRPDNCQRDNDGSHNCNRSTRIARSCDNRRYGLAEHQIDQDREREPDVRRAPQ